MPFHAPIGCLPFTFHGAAPHLILRSFDWPRSAVELNPTLANLELNLP